MQEIDGRLYNVNKSVHVQGRLLRSLVLPDRFVVSTPGCLVSEEHGSENIDTQGEVKSSEMLEESNHADG